MKRLVLGAALACGCAFATLSMPAMAAGGAYEMVPIPGSAQAADMFFRINTATGATMYHFGASSNTNLLPVADKGTLPGGDYHLYPWAQPKAANGAVDWNIYRGDKHSGRMWVLLTANGSWSWEELSVAPPAKPSKPAAPAAAATTK